MIISSNNQALLICNIALSYIGLNSIISFEDTNKESSLCKFWYELSKIEVLSSYPFKSTIREISLKPIKNSSLNYDLSNLYQNYYILPKNCLEIISINGTNEYYNNHEIIACNFSPIIMRYIYKLEDNEIPINISKLIAIKLACNMSMALHNDTNFLNYILKRFDIEFKKIANLDAQKGNIRGVIKDVEEETSWILSRR